MHNVCCCGPRTSGLIVSLIIIGNTVSSNPAFHENLLVVHNQGSCCFQKGSSLFHNTQSPCCCLRLKKSCIRYSLSTTGPQAQSSYLLVQCIDRACQQICQLYFTRACSCGSHPPLLLFMWFVAVHTSQRCFHRRQVFQLPPSPTSGWLDLWGL